MTALVPSLGIKLRSSSSYLQRHHLLPPPPPPGPQPPSPSSGSGSAAAARAPPVPRPHPLLPTLPPLVTRAGAEPRRLAREGAPGRARAHTPRASSASASHAHPGACATREPEAAGRWAPPAVRRGAPAWRGWPCGALVLLAASRALAQAGKPWCARAPPGLAGPSSRSGPGAWSGNCGCIPEGTDEDLHPPRWKSKGVPSFQSSSCGQPLRAGTGHAAGPRSRAAAWAPAVCSCFSYYRAFPLPRPLKCCRHFSAWWPQESSRKGDSRCLWNALQSCVFAARGRASLDWARAKPAAFAALQGTPWSCGKSRKPLDYDAGKCWTWFCHPLRSSG